MPYNEKLADRIREALVKSVTDIQEKQMFRGLCFMVNDKMCVCVSGDEMMCRIDPAIWEPLMECDGVRGMYRNNKPIVGYVYVAPDAIKTKKDFDYWIKLCLDFNAKAKSSKTKKKK